VTPIAAMDFAAAPAAHPTVAEATRDMLSGLDCPTFVIVNGRWMSALAQRVDLPAGVQVQGLAAALRSDPRWLEPHLARHAAYADHPFTALNTAFCDDGVVIQVPRGVVVDEPIQLLFVSEGTTAFESHPRVLVVAESESQVTIVENWTGRGAYFTNAVTEIVIGEAASVSHVRLQREADTAFHVARVHATLGRQSHFASWSLALGSSLVRCETDVVFEAEGGASELYGLYAASGTQHSDNRSFIDHAQPHCTSQQLYKGVLAGSARGVFNGSVIVRPDAQKTNARQTNRNLLLSESALVDTKPQLEIHADDVRCTHGATIGRLDEAPLFYLQSRGIGRREAQEILIQAFAREVVAKSAPETLRSALEAQVEVRIAALGGGVA
jgi:Fe-S cluster assembly protein SufD